jgi:cytochrome c-type biogenesis protein CcmH
MLFWTTAVLLTFGAVHAVLVPLTRRLGASEAVAGHDLEVYRDQLEEVDRDLGRGALRPEEANEARAEISRRILKLATGSAPSGEPRNGLTRAVGLAAALSVPLVAWGLYASVGSPDLPSQPLQTRLEADPAKASVEELVARAEAHLAANPEDGRGWDVIAPVYLRVGRPEDSATAYGNAIRLLGSTGVRESGLGEALAGMSGGRIGPESAAAFERALALEPGQAKATFFLGVAEAQQRKFPEAEQRWAALLAVLPQDSSWRAPTERALADVRAEQARVAVGPSEEEVDAAASMPSADRDAMIAEMVARLDARLAENPLDGEGWRQLVRSYVVLGRLDDAQGALERGLNALDGGEADELTNLGFSLGLKVTAEE